MTTFPLSRQRTIVDRRVVRSDLAVGQGKTVGESNDQIHRSHSQDRAYSSADDRVNLWRMEMLTSANYFEMINATGTRWLLLGAVLLSDSSSAAIFPPSLLRRDVPDNVSESRSGWWRS
jgi:hypothetical protein